MWKDNRVNKERQSELSIKWLFMVFYRSYQPVEFQYRSQVMNHEASKVIEHGILSNAAVKDFHVQNRERELTLKTHRYCKSHV